MYCTLLLFLPSFTYSQTEPTFDFPPDSCLIMCQESSSVSDGVHNWDDSLKVNICNLSDTFMEGVEYGEKDGIHICTNKLAYLAVLPDAEEIPSAGYLTYGKHWFVLEFEKYPYQDTLKKNIPYPWQAMDDNLNDVKEFFQDIENRFGAFFIYNGFSLDSLNWNYFPGFSEEYTYSELLILRFERDVPITLVDSLLQFMPEKASPEYNHGFVWRTTIIPSVEEERQLQTMQIYPNPTSETLTIQVLDRNIFDDSPVIVADMQGRVLLKHSLPRGADSFTIDVQELSVGTYILRCGKFAREFVVNR
jgi:hypothetical protein